ncbi:uncharacterized protein Z518_08712 [Rhinocladiella mackenziei CBS 650.93]|uniref:Major facilitator superfamily (MFS) profile domain-containing protein n=1 Tax=Rhinocladiella mackenziei CBS 650.93 TaxID=1442369 RepID=A0A0D2J1I5_9EURO|nr:uncharacterized protein Z518_08712 [Rhinocladiella mackenziei CBS 650.93]KIX02770.1 hypothetical protein Z518_08712 [Rhinocladiella mackenziei CBS 650.93]
MKDGNKSVQPTHLEDLGDDMTESKVRGHGEDQNSFSPKEIGHIRRRIDYRLVPALGMLFAISLMDRSNISAAAIAGMRVDLDLLSGYRYSLITLSFFITYVIVQAPMTIVCHKAGPRFSFQESAYYGEE